MLLLVDEFWAEFLLGFFALLGDSADVGAGVGALACVDVVKIFMEDDVKVLP